ncbi:MAG: xylose isomerase, partial [Clostridia bacterium]|nr:xylose isomerase [Clostridia bacterium]
MAEIFQNLSKVPYEGPESKNPIAFKYYNPDRVILGKKMSEHLPFAMAWWHNLGATGVDMFGSGAANKSFGTVPGTMEHAKAKVDAGFEFMTKLGIEYFCFHDVDLVPEAATIDETNARLDELTDYMLEKMKGTNIKCLWGTANMFSNPRYINGAASSNSVDVFCHAAAQVKKALDCTVKLGGRGYVFWGGREGYETLLNTDMKFEQENIASLMKMAVEYGRSIGFTGDFYIEPKPKEPMKHQYDFDAATAIGFLKQYGLDKDFKLNIEANHATLAGHTFQHDLRVSAVNGMLGSVDANQGDLLLGWDTDEFPFNVY